MKWLTFYYFLSACSALQSSDATSCRQYAEDSQWQDAIDCFENGDYEEDPSDDLDSSKYEYLAQWAASYAGKYGLAGDAILDQVLDSDNSSTDFSTAAGELLAAGTLTASIAEIQRGLSLLLQVPEAFRNSQGDQAAYYAKDIETVGSLMTLFLVEMQKTEFSSILESGLSQEVLIAKADAVLETLATGGQVVSDPNIQSQLDEVFSEIDNQPGENTADKLESLIESG